MRRDLKQSFKLSGPKITTLRIVLLYALGAGLWIAFSDYILEYFIRTPREYTVLQTTKGWGFVFITSVLLYLLIRQQMRRITRSQSDLQFVINQMIDGVLIVDSNLGVMHISPSLQKMLGLDESATRELVQAPFKFWTMFSLRYPDGNVIDTTLYPSARALRGEAVQNFEARLLRRDQKEILISISAAPVRMGPQKEVEMAVSVIHDITEIKKLEKIKEEFLSTVAHELKTPISVIKGYMEMMDRWKPQKPDPKESVAMSAVIKQCDRMTRMISGLIEFSRFQADEMKIQAEPMDLAQLVKTTVDELQNSTEKHHLALELKSHPEVNADQEKIRQIILNFLDNAIRFSPKGGNIEVSVATKDGSAIVAVRDYGIGIPMKLQDQLFQTHFKSGKTVHPEYSGIGIGLYISNQIAKSHDGKIWFESKEEKGTTFFLELPLRGSSLP